MKKYRTKNQPNLRDLITLDTGKEDIRILLERPYVIDAEDCILIYRLGVKYRREAGQIYRQWVSQLPENYFPSFPEEDYYDEGIDEDEIYNIFKKWEAGLSKEQKKRLKQEQFAIASDIFNDFSFESRINLSCLKHLLNESEGWKLSEKVLTAFDDIWDAYSTQRGEGYGTFEFYSDLRSMDPLPEKLQNKFRRKHKNGWKTIAKYINQKRVAYCIACGMRDYLYNKAKLAEALLSGKNKEEDNIALQGRHANYVATHKNHFYCLSTFSQPPSQEQWHNLI